MQTESSFTLPVGVSVTRFPSWVEVYRNGTRIGSIPVPYTPQDWPWWSERIAELLAQADEEAAR